MLKRFVKYIETGLKFFFLVLLIVVIVLLIGVYITFENFLNVLLKELLK